MPTFNKGERLKITRKDFLVKSAKGIAIIILPSIFSSYLESCNNPTGPTSGNASALQAIQGTLANGKITVGIDPTSALAKSGGAAIVNYSSGSLLIDHPSANTYNALSAICTHQGCVVNTYDSGSNQFVCPCHGSHFDTSGNVVQGPAPAPLTKYQTSFSNNQLVITL
jgi:cytochrome b6-f complex iron-sulfur subunit